MAFKDARVDYAIKQTGDDDYEMEMHFDRLSADDVRSLVDAIRNITRDRAREVSRRDWQDRVGNPYRYNPYDTTRSISPSEIELQLQGSTKPLGLMLGQSDIDNMIALSKTDAAIRRELERREIERRKAISAEIAKENEKPQQPPGRQLIFE